MMSAIPDPENISTTPKETSKETEEIHDTCSFTGGDKSLQTVIAEAATAFGNKDYEASVQLYAKALEQTIIANSGDQMHPSAGPLYLAYGKALLQLAISNQSLGIVNESMIDYNLEGDETDKLFEFDEYEDEKEDESDDGEEEEEPEASLESEGDGKEVEEPESKEDSEKENEPEKIEETDAALEDDFALAWEVLDIARLIFSKDESNKFLEAEALQEIGDLSMETENFTNAVSDYSKALELLVACDAALRELASINFKLGIALEFEGRDLGEACAAYGLAKEHLQNYLAKGVNEDETDEIQTLIQEVENKLTELKNGNVGSIKDALLDAAKQVSPSAFPSDANPVKDISGLVKKRRHEDAAQASQEEGPSKQSKTADDN
jgi:hypothetical protein